MVHPHYFRFHSSSILLAFAAKLLCVTSEEHKGEQTVSSCLAKGEEFAIVDDYGIVHILSPREIALTKAFNPQILEQRAYSMKYQELAPAINPLKRRAVMSSQSIMIFLKPFNPGLLDRSTC